MLTGLPPFYSKDRERLFENIRGLDQASSVCSRISRGDLRFPTCISAPAKDLLMNLFNRNPNLRLGGGKRDAAEVKEHVFFTNLDWDQLLRKEVIPPFKPQLKSLTDVQNFDTEFVCLPAVNSEVPDPGFGKTN